MGSLSRHTDNLRHFSPEVDAGGFTRFDGTVAFYIRVNALIEPHMVVLDLGAGRGAELQGDSSRYRNALSVFRGRVARLVGVDVDDAVLENPFLDEAQVIDGSGPLPFPDATFDVIFSDWVLEHVATPDIFASEVGRVLKPGGWFCARTPNRWGMTGFGANLLPNERHAQILKRLQPDREERDVFPTTYMLNSMSRLTRYFTAEAWQNCSYFYSAEPAYFLRSRLMMRLAMLFIRIMPASFGTDLHVFLRKR